MITHPELDFEEASRLRDEGLEKAIAHSKEEWRVAFEWVAVNIVRREGSVTSEEVTALVGMPPGNSNAIGAIMRATAKKNGWILSYESSRKPSSHTRVIGRWQPEF